MRLVLAVLLVARVAAARSFEPSDIEPVPEATSEVAASPVAPPPPPQPRPAPGWRFEGGFGVRFGSQLIDGRDVGTVVPLHLDAGVRGGHWLVYGTYDLMAFTWPGPSVSLSGQPAPGSATTGLLQRLGGAARYAIGRVGEKDMESHVWAEAGAGVEHVAWDAGGTWTRPDLALGVGATMFGKSDDKHGGMTIGFRVLLARRDNATGMPSCAGPCDTATTPSGWDRSIVFDMTLLFGT